MCKLDKKMIWITAIFAVFFYLSVITVSAKTEMPEAENQFIIMFDVSGSMGDFDESKCIHDMIALFVDRIPKNQYPVKIAIIPFDTEPGNLAGMDEKWWVIKDDNDIENKTKIKEKIAKLNYDGQDTDLGKAFRYCSELLAEMRIENKECRQVVLFLTDGIIDYASREKKLDRVLESYDTLMKAADTFPEDCYFLGIVPKGETIDKQVEYESREDSQAPALRLIRYCKVAVPETYQERMEEAVNAMANFVARLKERQPEGQLYESRNVYVEFGNKQSSNEEKAEVLDQIALTYDDFLQSVFHTKIISKDNIDLKQGYNFALSDVLDEVDISIIPNTGSIYERRDIVYRLLAEDCIHIDGYPNGSELEISGSGSAVTIKMMNPEPGNYCIRSDLEEQLLVKLKYAAYGNLNIVVQPPIARGLLGQEIEISGTVVDKCGKKLTEIQMQNIELWSRYTGENKYSVVEKTNGGDFTQKIVLKRPGENYITFGIEYNDEKNNSSPSGVSNFTKEILPICVVVPKVMYQVLWDTDELTAQTRTTCRISPYSEWNEEVWNISAENCMTYLGDKWTMQINDVKTEMKLSEDKNSFIAETVFPEPGNYLIEFINESTGGSIKKNVNVTTPEIQMEIESEGVVKSDIPIRVAIDKGKVELESCHLCILDEKGDLCKEQDIILKNSEGKYIFIPEKIGTYRILVSADGTETFEKQLKVINHPPKETENYSGKLEYNCSLFGKCISEEIDIRNWFIDPDGHPFEIRFAQNPYFKVEPEIINSKGEMKIRIIRKSNAYIHLPHKENINFELADIYGAKNQDLRSIVVKENGVRLIVVGILIIGITVFLIIAYAVRRSNMIKIKVYKNGIRRRSILMPKNKRKRIYRKIEKNILRVYKVNNVIYYSYQDGEERLVENNIINL